MDTNPAPTAFIPTLTLLIGGTVLLAGYSVMISGAESTSPGLTLAAIGFVDDDAVSAAEGTFVGKDVVDDLHSEVVVRVVEPD